MRVLFISPYISTDTVSCFTRNKTGFGYMVYDIARYVAQKEDVDLFATNIFTTTYCLDGINILKWDRLTFLKNLRLRNLISSLKFLKRYHVSNRAKLKVLFAFLTMGRVEKIINKYDIVHIHGCSPLTEAAILCCKKNKIPYVITLHGLNSFDDTILLEPAFKQYEKDFLKTSANEKRQLIFISSGNLDTINNYLQINSPFTFISNGCNINARTKRVDIRKLKGIGEEDFVFIFVGNISKNKNQIQAARVFSKTFKDDNIKLLFLGAEHDNNEVRNFINDNNIQNRIILCGVVPKDDVADYYMAADATILTSKSEGFGLSIIEGFVYGKPSLTFGDLPAVKDIFAECAMVNPRGRSDDDLAAAMVLMMQKKWDVDAIKKHAENFSLEAMADNYINVYKKVIHSI